MEQGTLIYVEENDKTEARVLSEGFANKNTRNRAYFNALGAELGLKYLSLENINNNKTYNLHNVKKILEEFDISDIMLSNIHIDVRMVFDENYIFIPKSHFEYDILPDIYFVMKLSADHSHVEFLGFFEPKLINKNNKNDKYYFIEKEKLSAPSSLKEYIENFRGDTLQNLSEEDNDNAKLLMVSLLDQNISKEDIKSLFAYLVKSKDLRDEFVEFENFETLSFRAERSDEVKDLSNNLEMPLDITLDDISGIEKIENITELDDKIDSSDPETNNMELNEINNELSSEPLMEIEGVEVLEDIEDKLENVSSTQTETTFEAETIDFNDIDTTMPKEVTLDLDDNVAIDENSQDTITHAVNIESLVPSEIQDIPQDEEYTPDNTMNIEDIKIQNPKENYDSELREQNHEEEILDENTNSIKNELDSIPNVDEAFKEFEFAQDELQHSEIDSDLAEIKKEIDEDVEKDSNNYEQNSNDTYNIDDVQSTSISAEATQNNEIQLEETPNEITDETFGDKYLDEVEHAYNQDYLQGNDSDEYINQTLQSDQSEIETLFNENSEIDFEKEENTVKLNSPMLNKISDNKLNIKLIAAGVLTFIIVGAIGFGLVAKYKQSTKNIDSLSQEPAEAPISKTETDNPSLLETTPEVETISANQATSIQPSTLEKTQSKGVISSNTKPINQTNSNLSVQKLVWSTPEYLSYSTKMKDYLQTAGKSIKLTLSSDLLLVNEYAYSNTVKISMTLSNDGNIKDIKLVKSSGSTQIDNLVLQTVKDTLNVIKPATGEVPTPQFNLGLTINF